jgi:hypothetical protein
MTLVTETYDYIPTTVTFSGGAFALLKPNAIQVSGAKTTAVDLEGVSFDLTGVPQLTISGPIEVSKNVEDIVGELETSVQDITIDSITYEGCKCVSSNIQMQGSPDTAIYLAGSITYQYESDNEFTPAEVTFSGGGSATLHVQNFSVSENTVLIYAIDNDDPVELPTGPGQIQMSGVIAVDQDGELTLEDVLAELGTDGITITVGDETYSDCLCTGASVQVQGDDISTAVVVGTLTYSYTVESAYTPVDVTLSGGSTVNLFVQNLSIQENLVKLYSVDSDDTLELPTGPGQLSMSGIVLNGTSTDILDDLKSDVTITVGTDEYVCTCTGSSVQTGGSQAYLTGSLNYQYDVESAYTPVDVTLSGGSTVNLFVQNISVSEPTSRVYTVDSDTPVELPTGPGQLSMSGIVLNGTSTDILDDLKSDVTITIGTDEYVCTCTSSSVQTGGSQAYLTGSLNYQYDVESSYTPVTFTFQQTVGETTESIKDTLLVRNVSIQENTQDVYAVDDSDPIQIATGPGQLSLSGIVVPDSTTFNTEHFLKRLQDWESVTITIGSSDPDTYSCTCTGVNVSTPGPYLEGSLSFQYEVESAYTPVDVTLSGGSTVNLFVQNLSIQENLVKLYSVDSDDTMELPTGPGQLSMSGIVLNGTSTDILDDLKSDVTITIGTDEYVCTCVSSSVQTGGSQAYLTGSLNYQYDVESAYTPVDVILSGGSTINLFVQNLSIQENLVKLYSVDSDDTLELPTGPGQLSMSGIVLNGTSTDILDDLKSDVTITIGTDEYVCTCVSSSVQTGGSQAYLTGSLNYQYDVESAYTPVDVTFSGGSTANLFVQNLSIQENLVKLYSVDSDDTLELPTGPGQLSMSGIVLNGTSTDILDDLKSDVTITIGTDEYVCTCTSSSIQTGGSTAYLTGSLNYQYDVESDYTPVDVTLSGGSTINLFVQNLSIQENSSEIFNLSGTEKSILLGPGQLSMSGIVLNGTSTDILDDLKSDVTITVGTDEYVCTCTSSSVQTGGSTAYITGQLTYEYDIDRTDIDVKLPNSLTIGNIGNLFAQNVTVQEPTHQELRSIAGTTQEIKVGPGQITISGVVVTGNASVINALTSPDPTALVTITMGGRSFGNCRCKGSQLQVAGQSASSTYLTGSITYEYIGTDINSSIIQFTVSGLSIFTTQVSISEGSVMQFDPGGEFKFVGPGSIDVSGLVIGATNPLSILGKVANISLGGRTYGGVRCIGSSLAAVAKDKYFTYYEGALKYIFKTINGEYSKGDEYTHAKTMTPQRRVLSDEIVDNGVPKIRYSVYLRKDTVHSRRTYTMDPGASTVVDSIYANVISVGWQWDDDHKMRIKEEQYFDMGATWDLEDQYDVEVGV